MKEEETRRKLDRRGHKGGHARKQGDERGRKERKRR